MQRRITRRRMLRNAALSAVAAGVAAPGIRGENKSPNEKLNIALIGCGGRGSWFVQVIPNLGRMAAMCDVNQQRAAEAYKKFPDVPKFEDFRVMLDKMGKEIDAVIVSTPDHTHAVAAAAALHAGKPVMCEKPLTRTVHEARALGELAAKQKLATQQGNQNGYDARAVELIAAGTIGEVREAHLWVEGGGPGPRPRPTGTHEAPPGLNWDLWLGPAADRPFHPDWIRGHGAGWRDFRTGNLGGWGSHSTATAFKALKLDTLWQIGKPATAATHRPIIRVTAECSEVSQESFPRWEVVRWEFPEREGMPPVCVYWYGSGAKSLPEQRRQALLKDQVLIEAEGGVVKFRHWIGSMLVGAKGLLWAGGYSRLESLLPKEKFEKVADPPQSLPRPLGRPAEAGWIAAVRGGPAPMCSFERFGGPQAEFYLLGNVATLFPGQTLEYDPISGTVLNNKPADQAVRPEYRKGWTLYCVSGK